MAGRTVSPVRVAERLKARFQRFMERPGTTVDLRPLWKLLPAVEEAEEGLSELTDEELTAQARALREACAPPAEGEPDGDDPTSAETLVTVCALAREAAKRGLDQRPFDVQLVGALAMLSGNVAEMATGEGKTLAAAIAAFGFSLRGEPIHVLTVNDYLARRDAEWMAPVYERLGLTVGWVTELSTPEERRAAYACDVTYVSVSEAGYDYLRDCLVVDVADTVQRDLGVVIVDEADSILIDEARVPLVVAGAIAGKPNQVETLTAINVALYARALVRRDVDYIVRGGKVELVDEFRGRVAHRRRWPDGLQAAVEAKEGLSTTAEGEVLGTTTVQALIRLYPTRCGMTATAALVGDELREFYDLEVAVIGPNTPCIRVDEPDRVYASREEKEEALIAEIAAAHATQRPVLIGTLDVAESERLAAALQAADIPCVVLNAKNDADEAAIIAEAGVAGAVTVSTQMAGRGVDIRLGGSDQADRDRVAELGGLYVIGTGRHDSRRVDDQLRGRAGRQGDPGGSVFFVSVEDDLVARHGQDALPPLHAEADGRLRDKAVNRAVEHAQRVAEGISFEIHRNTWRYNVVTERQRLVLAERRHEFLTTTAAAQLLDERTPDRYDEVEEAIGEEALFRAARLIVLYHVDRAWADHLAYLAEVREGVHLHALGRLDPLDEYHRVSVPAFKQLLSDVDDRTVATFEEVEITGPDWELADAGLARPTATWTYMVQDNPFGSEMERFFTALARAALGK